LVKKIPGAFYLVSFIFKLLQFVYLDIPEPYGIAVILEPYEAFLGNSLGKTREIFEFAVGNHLIPCWSP
jgi:hypothetical protein